MPKCYVIIVVQFQYKCYEQACFKIKHRPSVGWPHSDYRKIWSQVLAIVYFCQNKAAPVPYVDILFIGEDKNYAGLASKKGIAITAAIAAAIIGSSFLIWFIPQSSPGSLRDSPRAINEIISDVYSRHQSLAAGVESKFEQWKIGNVTSIDILSQINFDRSDIQNMRKQLDSVSSAQGWQESYNLYIQALDSFLDYLDLMQSRVENEDKLDSNLELDGLKQKWEGYVNGSINAMPI